MANIWIYWASLVALFVVLIMIACCESMRRKSPVNYVLLGILTACMSLMLGFTCAFFDTWEVMLAGELVKTIANFENSSKMIIYSGNHGRCDSFFSNFCFPNQMGLYYHGGSSFCGGNRFSFLSDFLSNFPKPCYYDCLCISGCFNFLHLLSLRHSGEKTFLLK